MRLAVKRHAPQEPPRPRQLKKLRVYAGPTHPHPAQQPQPPAARGSTPRSREEGIVTKPLIQTTGRRKEAVARVRLRPGTGKVVINGRDIEQLLPDRHAPHRRHRGAAPHPDRRRLRRRRHASDGGGIDGQAGALRLGIARALVALDPEARPGAEEGRAAHARRRARRSGASTASRRPARRRSTRSARRGRARGVALRVRHRRRPRRRGRDLTTELVARPRAAPRSVRSAPTCRSSSRATRVESGPMLEAALVAGICARRRRRRARSACSRRPGSPAPARDAGARRRR